MVEELVKKYGDIEAVRGVSFTVETGEVYALLGPNGAGKSTILGIVTGVISPTSGRVLVDGLPPYRREARTRIGYAPQEHGLDPSLTGLENIAFYARLRGLSPREAVKQLTGLAEEWGLYRHLNRPVGKYSGGMARKLAVLVALIGDPRLLVLDEPTSGLDPGSRRKIWELVERLRGEGKAVLLATHYMEEAERLADRVGIIDRGVLVAEGAPDELKKKYGPPAVITVELYGEPGDRLVEELARLYGPTVSNRGNVVRVPVEDPDTVLPGLVETVIRSGGSIRSVRVEKPSLEDVFLKLTGRRIEDAEA